MCSLQSQRRKTKKALKKKLKERMNDTASEKVRNEIKESINILDEQDAHPRRPRSKYAGEMIQMDASSHSIGLKERCGICMLRLMMQTVRL